MQRGAVLALILIVLTSLHGVDQAAWATPDHTSLVTLYAHARPQQSGSPGPILTASPDWGPQQAARLQEGEVVFSLDPPIGGRITIDGTTTIRLWARSDTRLAGALAVFVTVQKPDGTQSLTHPVFNDTVFLDSRAKDINYLIVLNDVILESGSTIQLHVKLSSEDRRTGAYLLYDSQSTPTQITIPVADPTHTSISLLTPTGQMQRIFEAVVGNTNVTVQIDLADAFGLYRLATASVRVQDATGRVFLFVENVLGASVIQDQYRATFKATMNLSSEAYTVTLEIIDKSRNRYETEEAFYVAPYYAANLRVVDTLNRPIEGAQLNITAEFTSYAAQTNQTGWVTIRLPSSEIVGPFNIAVLWKNLTVVPTAELFVSDNTALSVIVAAYDLTIKVQLLWFMLPGAQVELMADSGDVATQITDGEGSAIFTQLPPREYSATIQYLGASYQTTINFVEPKTITIQVPLPFQTELPYVLMLVGVVSAASVVMRRRRLYKWPFDYINVLTKNGLPDSLTTTIVGSTGSGKSILMESLAHRSLQSGRCCVYVTNVEHPSSVRSSMKNLGMDTTEHENQQRLLFIDSYSALSGTPSTEPRSISSLTDLTSLGVIITRSIEETTGPTDVYFDALTPLFTALKPDYVLTFLQSIGAKVKSFNGSLCTILGTSVEKDTVTKVEEISDCVIETQLSETRSGQKRRLRIKKMRGHPYNDSWTRFTIGNDGIIFYTREPPRSVS